MSEEASLSGSQPTAGTGVDKSFARELGRRRVFAFFWVFAVVPALGVISTESDEFLDVLDEYVVVILVVIALVVLAYWWRKQSPDQLRKVNNIMTVLVVGLVLVTIFAMAQEYGDSVAFTDEGGKLIIGILLLFNRFV